MVLTYFCYQGAINSVELVQIGHPNFFTNNHQGNCGGFKYAPSPLLLCTMLPTDSDCFPECIKEFRETWAGLSISHVQRRGLSNLALSATSGPRVKCDLSILHFIRSSFLRLSYTSNKASLKKIQGGILIVLKWYFWWFREGRKISPGLAGLVHYTSGLAHSPSDKSRD